MTMETSAARLNSRAVLPLRTLDPARPLDDLEWLDEAVGDARVVAIGESAHYNREFFQLRHRLLRYLVERHGFSAYAMETGSVEGRLVDGWVRGGGEDRLGRVMADGLTSLMGLWTPMRAHLEWMRRHNSGAARPVGFHGIDLPGSMVSLLPGLDAVIAYLARADPEFRIDPGIRETAAAFAAPSAFSAPAAIAAYGKLTPQARDALTAGLADLAARMTGRRLDYLRRTTLDAYERALHALRVTVTLDAIIRAMARGDQQTVMFDRDAAIADTVEWILRGEERIVLAAHNGHVQRWPCAIPGTPAATSMGMHLADRLGEDYLVIGTTSGTGQTLNVTADFFTGTLFTAMEAPRPGSLDALMDASHDGPFATDLRRLSPADADAVRAASRQRAGNGTSYSDLSPLDAFDIVVHLPYVTAAEPDAAALAHSPRDVQEAFSRWKPE
ncbi:MULTISPECIES: erythromycin esterase family protein [Streptosporangium]|uniref:Erythromycin esterase n=1 Tax=Streptosporangium brasiliense TaxID=47480 RepID=A0ABT9RGP9_9ACTN|nr:erythromycin esterase family protein [Streptosporangium brasiliense]MDP9868425.1 erythromycin esterase [Streptosporangium brasiliense]